MIICAQTRHLTTSGGIELGVNVLTMSYWPPYTPAEVILPNQVSCKDGPLSTMCSSALDFLLSLIIYCPPPLPPFSSPRWHNIWTILRSSTPANTMAGSCSGSTHWASASSSPASLMERRSCKCPSSRPSSSSSSTPSTSSHSSISESRLGLVRLVLALVGLEVVSG